MSTETLPEAPIDTHAPVITEAQVRAFLADRYGPGVTAVEPLRQGGWSSAWGYRQDGHARVIRFSAYRDDFGNDRRAMRWSSPALPVPGIVAIGEAFGGYYAVSERVAGIPLDDLDGAGLRSALPVLLAMLDALREADPGGSGYGGWDADGVAPFPSWSAFLQDVATDGGPTRDAGWRAKLASSRVGIDRFDEAYAALADLAGAMPDDRHLVHSDLLNYNVLVSIGNAVGQDRRAEQAPQPYRASTAQAVVVSGVLDWGCGLAGDFVYDLAWFAWCWPFYPAWAAIDIVSEARRHYDRIGLAVPDLDRRLRCYALHIGLGDVRYNAFMGRWDLAETAASRILTLARDTREAFHIPLR